LVYRKGLLDLEKFKDNFDFDILIKVDELTINKKEVFYQPLSVFCNFTQAESPTIEADHIQEVFKTIDEILKELKGIKIAILAHSDLYEEPVKTNNFAIKATKLPIIVMVFRSRLSAFNWLDMPEKQQKTILNKLNTFS